MGIVTLPNLTKADTDPNLFSEVKANDQAIIDQVNGSLNADNLASNAVTTAKITDAHVTDAKLASPNNSTYKTLLTAKGFLAQDATAGTYVLGNHDFSTAGATKGLDDGSVTLSTNTLILPPDLFYFDNDDYTVAGKTQKLRLRAVLSANATAPGINFTFGLYPVTVAGAADAVNFTLGTVVSDSTVALNTPSSSTVTSGVNSDFTIPSDGAYVLAVVTSNTLTNNAAVTLHAQLQTRNV